MIPPGQNIRSDFPRFGLPQYAQRFPSRPRDKSILIVVKGIEEFDIDDALADLPRTTMQTDFHCVTTWTYPDVKWGGVKFSEFFLKHIKPLKTNGTHFVAAVLYAQDGYRTTLLLEDLLKDDVMLADSLDDLPLSIEHGAPLRLIAPAHYGYKNVKHLKKIEFYQTVPVIKRGMLAFLDHPRARVHMEERGRWIPGWVLRYVFRPFISRTVRAFSVAAIKRLDGEGL